MTVAEFAFALSARRYFAFSSGESQFPVPLTYFVFFLSNTGLFHLIYKTVNDFMQSKPSHLNEPHRCFFATMKCLFLLLKCLLNEFKYKKGCIHV